MPQTLQCPRCNQAVTVEDHAAGKRVKCPHCEQNFLAPGFAASENDDDDWLQMDEKTSPQPAVGPASKPPAKPQAKGPNLSADDQAVLAEFTSELDEFTAEIGTPPPPSGAPNPQASADVFRGLPPIAAGASQPAPTPPKKTPPPQAAAIEYATEYRVNCPICGSMTYVKATQAGHTIKCSDCHSPITVPQPPRIRKKHEIDIDNAETFQLEAREEVDRPKDPFKKSADELLAEAERVDEESPEPDFDAPSVKEWAAKVFGIFRDPGVLFHWLILSVVGSVPAFVLLNFEMFEFVRVILFPSGLFLAALTVVCGFAILQSIANDEERVSEWPIFDVFGWLGQLIVALAAAGIAAVPAWALGQLAFGPDIRTIGLTMVSVYLVFPFVVLSMLDMQSPFVPFSAEVARSVTKSEEAWGGFYFSSGLLFFALFLILVSASILETAVGSVLGIFATIAVTFIYFSMIGRLAYSIGQAVNDPPMVNEIDRSVRSDSAEK